MQTDSLGKWAHDNLASTVQSNSGTGYYQNLPMETHFAHAVAKIIQKRRAKNEESLYGAPSLYILGPCPSISGMTVKREPMFDAGGAEVAGRVWFGPQSMASSRSFVLPSKDADEIFNFVDRELGAGNSPTVYFDAAADKLTMRFYPKGLNAETDRAIIRLDGAHITTKLLKEFLDTAYKKTLMTPVASGLASQLWEDGSKTYPAERAERIIQDILEASLAVALGAVMVKREHTGKYGRFDLSLTEQDPLDASKTTNHAMLELKVVKSFTSKGTAVQDAANQAAILKGMKQANAYREDSGSRIAAVCCYDMQKAHLVDKCFDHIRARALKLSIELWAWPLFSTTEAARDYFDANVA